MNVLVIGSGGREHALAWKIAQSGLVDRVFCAPGNPGMAKLGQCVEIAVTDFDGLVGLAKEQHIRLTVVGPEDPLARGIVDRFAAEGLMVFGPTAAAAQLEASKSFAKRIMKTYRIPTAEYAEFTDAGEAVRYVHKQGTPIVIKADGLAAGKGVTVAHDVATAVQAIRTAMVDQAFGIAGRRVVIEECLVGEEASILAFTDGLTVLPMVPSQDHKAVYDSDLGPNTGGMGAYAPAPVVTDELLLEITETILRPCVRGMATEGAPYRGVLYAGLMITEHGPKVIEFNCRFGDPETQAVLPVTEVDIVPLLLACCTGSAIRLSEMVLPPPDRACVSVVMASGGYPGSYEKGKPITGIERAEAKPGVVVFHAGTKKQDGTLVTNGGRVLNVTATARDIPSAIAKAYEAVGHIGFEGSHHRTDIGRKALAYMAKNRSRQW